MKIRKLAIVAVAGGALMLAGCGTPRHEARPGSPGSPTATRKASASPSLKSTTPPKATKSPTSTSSSASASAPKAGGRSPSGNRTPSPSAPASTPENGGQTIDPKADESAQPTKSGEQGAVLSRVPGKKTDKCVSVGSERDLRSGDFLAGPFDAARKQYGHNQPGATKRSVRLYFVPLHAKKMPGLKLTFTNATGETVVTRQKQIADAEQWQFYDTTTVLKTPGQWKVRAQSGPDRGCFTFKLPG